MAEIEGMIYLIAALAVWRIAVMLVEEAGPGDVFLRLRERVGIVRYPDGTVQAPRTFAAGVLTCVRCASVWLALAATIIVWPGTDWQAWILLPAGMSGAAVLIEVFRR